jgi:hypothetical protein
VHSQSDKQGFTSLKQRFRKTTEMRTAKRFDEFLQRLATAAGNGCDVSPVSFPQYGCDVMVCLVRSAKAPDLDEARYARGRLGQASR